MIRLRYTPAKISLFLIRQELFQQKLNIEILKQSLALDAHTVLHASTRINIVCLLKIRPSLVTCPTPSLLYNHLCKKLSPP